PIPAKDDNTGLLERILDGTVELLERVKILEQNSNAIDEHYKTATESRVDNIPGIKQDSLFCYETATIDQAGVTVTEQHCTVTDKQYIAATQYDTATDKAAEPQEQHITATETKPKVQGPGRNNDGDMYILDVSGDDSMPSMAQGKVIFDDDLGKDIECCLGGSEADDQQAKPQEPTPPVAGTEVDPGLAAIKAMQDTGTKFDEIRKALRSWVKANYVPKTRPYPALADMVNAAGIVTKPGGRWIYQTVQRLVEGKKKGQAQAE
ncbi:MAG: hypothetical protein HQK58_16235, partial [Deltaproteobacteria bacterium]|nr:hypothetical protein [Deltaproteobacteria bacterium]